MHIRSDRQMTRCRLLSVAATALVLAIVPLGVSRAAERPIRVGSKALTEGVILGEMLRLLAEQAAGRCEHLSAMGGTQIVFKALETGAIDGYADYTGTLIQEVLRSDRIRDEDELRQALSARGIGMTQKLGFNNTYALGMREQLAEELRIRKISDLSRHPELVFGFSNEFKGRNDGWAGLKRAYGLSQDPKGMDHDLAYRGLENGTLQVTDVNSTDADIRYYDLRVLEDDLHFFPIYQCVILYRSALKRKHPQVVAAWKQLEGEIDEETMIELNKQVKIDHRSERQAALFLLRDRKDWIEGGRSRSSFYWDLLQTTRDHLNLVALSLAASVVVAIPLGIAAAKMPRIGRGILGIVGVLQTIPSMALLVLMIPLLGIGFWPAIAALFLYSLLPIVRNTYVGLTGIPVSLRESAAVLGLGSVARLRLIELPLASPLILAGIKTAAVINVGTATIGVLIGAGGYGDPILNGVRLNNNAMILQGAIPAALMAIAVQFLFDGIEKWCIPEGLRTKP